MQRALMKVVIAGGSGFIGRTCCGILVSAGHQVTVLSRHPSRVMSRLPAGVTAAAWDGATHGSWEWTLEDADAVVNLAGEPIADARWTESRKLAIRNSRIGTTKLLVEALAALPRRPKVLLNASAIGYYPVNQPEALTEDTPPGTGFLADLCVEWERAATQAEALGLRVVRLRTGMVLGNEGGALSRMLLPFKLYIGGPIAPGTQWVSWIHVRDLAGLIAWGMEHDKVTGPVNGVAPNPVNMREFCRRLGKVLGRPSWLPVPEFTLKLALGELATLLTTGQRIEPAVAVRHGYVFTYPDLENALQSLLESAAT
ncbi:MAG: TIGR01777 family oxidoreductase [Nitrospirales bacterium]